KRSSRREFLKTAGILAGTLPLAKSLEAVQSPVQEQPGQVLRKRLHERRSKIETLHVEYTYQSTKENDLRNGRNQLFMSRNRFHVRNERKEGSIVQIIDGEQGLDAFIAPDGTVTHARIWETSGRKSPPRPLENFLPQLEDKPMNSRGFRQIEGDRCQGILQGDRLLWISSATNVVRSAELFRTADQIEERMTFGDFEELAPGLLFPRSVRVLIYGDQGEVVVERTITVHSLRLNEPLPERLFSVRDFPTKGEKANF
ncbi:MAG TPA: hypothetical protein VLE27_05485, partial [Thermoanaerobaculia bacterium]|nr:hypothetical protein [Thermoanaerobaculia bacterium]